MLTKRDVENLFNRVACEEWEYWRDSGNYHCWFLSGGDWLLQVSHARNEIVISDQQDTDPYTMTAARYHDVRLGVRFVAAAAKAPEAAHKYLSDQPQSLVVESEISWGKNGGGSRC